MGWQAGEGDGEPPPSNTGGGCGGVLHPASDIRGEGGPGSGDEVLVSAADSPGNKHDRSTIATAFCLHANEKQHHRFLEATNRN